MTYQSAINTFFLARFPAALMCLIVTPFWAKADDMDTTIFISLIDFVLDCDFVVVFSFTQKSFKIQRLFQSSNPAH
ncbi:hypothetical protein QG033_02115 [Kingella kingae]|uniref:hypothetical protein n=1 Tax=Kingella kingae TaxID=504 RepID=UPI000429E0DE|nr:hypothetical protein [Kingella kingae]MDK4529676.1 hypothetical protein [Kingella kingae]MDK4579664.1 hypothetical protein [Kingella kingae]